MTHKENEGREPSVTSDNPEYSSRSDVDKNDFDIESLDPDERSWYYDGTGVKRRKPSDE